MGFTMLRRVRTGRVEGLMLPIALVRMYAAFDRCSFFTGKAVFRISAPRCSRPHRKRLSAFYGQAVKTSEFSLPLSARNCTAIPMADRLDRRKRQWHFSFWAAEVTAVTALPLGEPTVLCSRMDESIIVGYYTSAEVDSTYSQPSQIAHERSLTHGKKRWN